MVAERPLALGFVLDVEIIVVTADVKLLGCGCLKKITS